MNRIPITKGCEKGYTQKERRENIKRLVTRWLAVAAVVIGAASIIDTQTSEESICTEPIDVTIDSGDTAWRNAAILNPHTDPRAVLAKAAEDPRNHGIDLGNLQAGVRITMDATTDCSSGELIAEPNPTVADKP